MASRAGAGSLSRPEAGQLLLVVHDFEARSTDELSLRRGDRVKLIERDDDFGDGWYLGQHLGNGNNGLFPEVYTKPLPRNSSVSSVTAASPRSATTTIQPPTSSTTSEGDDPLAAPRMEPDQSPEENLRDSTLETSGAAESKAATPKKAEFPGPVRTSTSASDYVGLAPVPKITAIASGAADRNQESPVMNETLSVIQEHISDLNSPHNSIIRDSRRDSRMGNDSGSEYSSHLDHRMSYINGEETDEEEDNMHSLAEVNAWTPDQVAQYLHSVGVEPKHCEVFREQEISGEVLLGMEQTSVFLKEFELGSVGRRLKTWQKIKALQDEVKSATPLGTRRTTQNYGSEIGSEDAPKHRSRTSTLTSASKDIGHTERAASAQANREVHQRHMKTDSMPVPTVPVPSSTVPEPLARPGVEPRPSAASIRDLHHSRRHSSHDWGSNSLLGKVAASADSSSPSLVEASHKKQPSFDRTWTMGNGSPSLGSPSFGGRPLSSAGFSSTLMGSEEATLAGSTQGTPVDIDRGYFSGGEFDGRKRNVLRKKDSISHSRKSSYADDQKPRNNNPLARHSRFGSVDSVREAPLSSAAHKYYGLSLRASSKRTPSSASNEGTRPSPQLKDVTSPTVTKLDGASSPNSQRSPVSRQVSSPDWLLPRKSTVKNRMGPGARTTSEAVTNPEKARITSPTEEAPRSSKDSPLQSPSIHTGSSTPSKGASFEADPASAIRSPLGLPLPTRGGRRKSKKETSAYTRGLMKISPQEQMISCDYSGWMKKKSSNLMTTWKPRLFILKGRRLSYYYSENDEEEKGLIDISFHKVLPANNDRMVGLHATFTGATSSSASPPHATMPTLASTEAAAEKRGMSSLSTSSASSRAGGGKQQHDDADDAVFIFKLVPPRPGLSRAVNFTKPTTHYFAVPNLTTARLWMGALMKATIDKDDTKPVTTTYQQETISLAKAQQMRHRPPALMNLDEKDEEAPTNGLNIKGVGFDGERNEEDSGVSGVSKADG